MRQIDFRDFAEIFGSLGSVVFAEARFDDLGGDAFMACIAGHAKDLIADQWHR